LKNYLFIFGCTGSYGKAKVAQSCPTLCDLVDYTVHGILQARILERVAFPFSKASSQPRDFAGSCSQVCPKGVDPAMGIQLLRGYLLGFRS